MVYPEPKQVKRFAIIAVLLVLAACAVWQKLQIMAITAIIAVLALAYRDHTRQIFEVGLKLLRGTTQAKFGSLELTLTELTDKVEKVERATWVSIMLSQLSAEEVGLLVDVAKTKEYSPPDAVKGQLRKLRAKGLIKHDEPLLADSSRVWLTEAGVELARMLEPPEENLAPTVRTEEHGVMQGSEGPTTQL